MEEVWKNVFRFLDFNISIAESECFTPTVPNGWVEANSNIWGNNFVGRFRYSLAFMSNILYLSLNRCFPGFDLTGEDTLKCRNGVWNIQPEDFPVCAGKRYQALV